MLQEPVAGRRRGRGESVAGVGSEVIAGMEGLRQRYGIDSRDVVYFTHGTTVGVNAVVQRKGLRLGLVTTRNFEDVLDIEVPLADLPAQAEEWEVAVTEMTSDGKLRHPSFKGLRDDLGRAGVRTTCCQRSAEGLQSFGHRSRRGRCFKNSGYRD